MLFARRGSVLLLMAVVSLGLARTAEATCGDWLDDGDHNGSSLSNDPSDSALESLPCHCRAPMCDNGAPHDHPLPAPDVDLNPQRDFATLRERLGSESLTVSWNTRRGSVAEHDGFPVTIERPPRPA